MWDFPTWITMSTCGGIVLNFVRYACCVDLGVHLLYSMYFFPFLTADILLLWILYLFCCTSWNLPRSWLSYIFFLLFDCSIGIGYSIASNFWILINCNFLCWSLSDAKWRLFLRLTSKLVFEDRDRNGEQSYKWSCFRKLAEVDPCLESMVSPDMGGCLDLQYYLYIQTSVRL